MAKLSRQCHCFRANKAISEVRTKQGAEVATLQVQLKREQLKVQSLEKDLGQKVHERTQGMSLLQWWYSRFLWVLGSISWCVNICMVFVAFFC